MTPCSTETDISYLKLWPLLFAIAFVGCKSGTISDPNDPPKGSQVNGDILLRNVGEVMRVIDQRIALGEVTMAEREQILQREVSKMLKDTSPNQVPDKQAWQFGDAYRLAGDWKTARVLYERAAAKAVSTDRKVNDTLRLARAQAHDGDIDQAVKTSRSVFGVGVKDKAPILLAVLYEIVPEGLGKGQDAQLAKLLEEAIAQHHATIINPTSDAGKAFLLARPSHVHNAWIKIAQIYQNLGMEKEARQAIMRDEADRQKSGSF